MQLFVLRIHLPQTGDIFLQAHGADGALHLLLTQVLQPILLSDLVKLSNIVCKPFAYSLVGEIGIFGPKEFVILLDEEGVILIWMSFEESQIYLFYPILVDSIGNCIQIGFIDKAFYDSHLLIYNYLLMDRFPNFLQLLISILGQVDSLQVEIDQFSKHLFELVLGEGRWTIIFSQFNSWFFFIYLWSNRILCFDLLKLILKLLILNLIVGYHSLQLVLQLIFMLLVIQTNYSTTLFLTTPPYTQVLLICTPNNILFALFSTIFQRFFIRFININCIVCLTLELHCFLFERLRLRDQFLLRNRQLLLLRQRLVFRVLILIRYQLSVKQVILIHILLEVRDLLCLGDGLIVKKGLLVSQQDRLVLGLVVFNYGIVLVVKLRRQVIILLSTPSSHAALQVARQLVLHFLVVYHVLIAHFLLLHRHPLLFATRIASIVDTANRLGSTPFLDGLSAIGYVVVGDLLSLVELADGSGGVGCLGCDLPVKH